MSAVRVCAIVLIASAPLIPLSTTADAAALCTKILADAPGQTAGDLADGQLVQRVPGGGWAVLPPGSVIGAPNRLLRLYYVVRESFTESRGGVLVVKTAKQRPVGGSAEPHTVQLSRLTRGVDNKNCGLVPRFIPRAIAASSYDAYHDEGRAIDEMADIKQFHFRYAARRQNCVWTNSNITDGIISDWRHNRGQFSFNTDIVNRYTIFQALRLLPLGPSVASSEGLERQRVRMIQYRTIQTEPTCIPVVIRVPGPASFIRINDLEALRSGGSSFVRATEQGWILSP